QQTEKQRAAHDRCGGSIMQNIKTILIGATICASVLLAALSPLAACPFCSAPTLTFAEQYAKADAAVLFKWLSGEMPAKEKLGSTSYEIVQVARTPLKSIEKGKKITLERYRVGKPGDLALLFGSRTKGDGLEWGSPLDVTEQSYKYIVEAPPAD